MIVRLDPWCEIGANVFKEQDHFPVVDWSTHQFIYESLSSFPNNRISSIRDHVADLLEEKRT